eukprot:767227-Hanusia_phi.AAC.2
MDILLHDEDAQILLRASAAVIKLMQNKVGFPPLPLSPLPRPSSSSTTSTSSTLHPSPFLFPPLLRNLFLHLLALMLAADFGVQDARGSSHGAEAQGGSAHLGQRSCVLSPPAHLTWCPGKAIEAEQLIKVVFTALPPIQDLPQRRARLDQSLRDKLRFSPHVQLAPCPCGGI